MRVLLFLSAFSVVPTFVFADAGGASGAPIDMTGTVWGITALVIFCLAYSLVPLEHALHLRKSKPVLLAAGAIWILAAVAMAKAGDSHTAHEAIRQNILEYGELLLFLLAAMTYINSLDERNVFQVLRAFLVSRGFSLRQVFWITGGLAFMLSPIADNLTTALLMGAVVIAVGSSHRSFVVLACINVVVAANAGGAFSPFGDITTLMVWQKGKVEFTEFFAIAGPSAVNWLVPAIFMNFAVPRETPEALHERVRLKYGAMVMIGLFLMTIALAVCFHSLLNLPPAAGMMFGLGFLGAFSYHIKMHEGRWDQSDGILGLQSDVPIQPVFVTHEKDRVISQIVDGSPYPALAIDADHRVTHFNRALEELTGIAAGEVVGKRKPWREVFDGDREIMADLVVTQVGGDEDDDALPSRVRRSGTIESGLEAVQFVPRLKRYMSSAAAPIWDEEGDIVGAIQVAREVEQHRLDAAHFDFLRYVARAEWDTMLFFYGVILCVGGLSTLGYLSVISNTLYSDLGPTVANSLVGVLSAILDNIPVMFAVLTMDPEMSHGQWLLVTLTAGVGGSLLSMGSAAGVALMGSARGIYTFGAHLKWTPVIALGYACSIACHLLLNARLM